ncbi:tyrosine-type recombinase/integrase [Aliarcobacter lanthieri]|uniref:tyrosine-type recombinase/integrase n=1 Tax=Aliarcobacter lanthieri TaxID=1355374 RepID=UPI0004B717D2|nr:integrase arm-type DNA-binding domain-containing protein [Aliarcobacter lanthieri]
MINKNDKKKEFTDLTIKNLKAKTIIQKNGTSKIVVNQISDNKIIGLSITIKPNNSKFWEFRYTSPISKDRRRTSLGKYPEVSLSKAREIAQYYRELLSQNIDPIDNKRDEIKSKELLHKGKIENAIDEWLKKERLNTTEVTHKSKKMIFEYVEFFFKKENIVYVKDIKIFDITKLLQDKEKTAPETASKLFSYIGNFFKFCILKGYSDTNLIANIRKQDILIKKEVKHMPKITDKEILKELIQAIYSNEEGSASVQNALKLVLHLPLRPDNLAKLKWEYIDFDKKLLIIPRSEMKVKNKNLPDFILPLTKESITILNHQKSFKEKFGINTEYVFFGKDYSNPIHNESTNKALKRLGFNNEEKGEKIRTHGFRGVFRSMIDTLDTDNQFSYEVKERALDHFETNKVARAYNHKADYVKQLVPLMEFWSSFIDNLNN